MMSDNINLKEINELYCDETAENIIGAALIYVNKLLNLKDEHKISDEQAQFFSQLIFQTCKVLTLPELGHMFARFLSGQYGKFYGQIDPMDLSRWCREYMKSRSEIILKDKELYKREESRIYGDPLPLPDQPSDPELANRIMNKIKSATSTISKKSR